MKKGILLAVLLSFSICSSSIIAAPVVLEDEDFSETLVKAGIKKAYVEEFAKRFRVQVTTYEEGDILEEVESVTQAAIIEQLGFGKPSLKLITLFTAATAIGLYTVAKIAGYFLPAFEQLWDTWAEEYLPGTIAAALSSLGGSYIFWRWMLNGGGAAKIYTTITKAYEPSEEGQLVKVDIIARPVVEEENFEEVDELLFGVNSED